MCPEDFCEKIKILRCRWPGYCSIAQWTFFCWILFWMLTMSSGLSMERMMVCRLRGTPLSWARWYTSSHCCHLLFSLQNILCTNGKVKSHCLFTHDLTSTPPADRPSQSWCSPPSGRRTPPMSPVQPRYRWPGNSGTWQPGKMSIYQDGTFSCYGYWENTETFVPYHCGSSLSKEASNYLFCSKFAVTHFSNF